MAKPIILIVERNPNMLQDLVLAFVRTERYIVYSSRSQEGAASLLGKHHNKIRPDVIITHFGGLVMDLRRFIHSVRKDSPNTQIIIFSENPMISSDYPVADIVHQCEPDGIEMLLHRVGPLIYRSAQISASASHHTPSH